jgi:hypothetical protein
MLDADYRRLRVPYRVRNLRRRSSSVARTITGKVVRTAISPGSSAAV